MKRYLLMQQVNAEGLYATVQASLPHFKRNGWKGRIIVVSPPIYSRFFRGKTAYAMGKVAMSILTKGLAMDWVREGKKDMAITSIWPATVSQKEKEIKRIQPFIERHAYKLSGNPIRRNRKFNKGRSRKSQRLAEANYLLRCDSGDAPKPSGNC
jgi:NAD(P)-dependent dehydrogenase (short-subunit alcohol dehydrogenase family)